MNKEWAAQSVVNVSDADQKGDSDIDWLVYWVMDLLGRNCGCVQQLADACASGPLLIKAWSETNLYLGFTTLPWGKKSFWFFESTKEKPSFSGEQTSPLVRLDNNSVLAESIEPLIIDAFGISTYEELYQEVASAYQERMWKELIAPLKPIIVVSPTKKTLGRTIRENLFSIFG